MKKFVFIILALVVSVYLFSYAKEEQYTTTAPKVPTKTEDVQNALMIVGYYRGSIDGKMGPLTKKAIEDFQKANNLQVDGKVGKKTRASLRVQVIQKFQTNLKNAGYYTAEIDGKMGPLTKKAIRDFQRDNNLQVDGKVGPKTWDKLSQYLNDLMAKQGCLSIYNDIYKKMDKNYYKVVLREEFEKFIDEVKSAFQNRILQQNELDYFRYVKPIELVTRLKNPQENYSYFYVGPRAEEIENTSSGRKESLGINEGQLIDKGFKVTEVEPRSDSYEQGLREKDIIIKIGDEFVKNLTNDQIIEKLHPTVDAKVDLIIISHQDNRKKILVVACKKFVKKPFLRKAERPDIFRIKINSFNEKLLDDLNEIFDDLKTKSISGIILDFRGNNGGMLDFPDPDNKEKKIYIIENLAGYFIEPGKRLYYIETKSSGQKEFLSKKSNYSGLFYSIPLIGLMNKETASAAELILGALRVYNRIRLVGQKSCGAGSNKYFESGYIEGKKFFYFILLTSLFYLSDGSTFDKEGLKPDYEILDDKEALCKAVDILVKRKGGKRDTP